MRSHFKPDSPLLQKPSIVTYDPPFFLWITYLFENKLFCLVYIKNLVIAFVIISFYYGDLNR